MACCGRWVNDPINLVLVVDISGEFEGYVFDHDLLMIDKGTIYFYAVKSRNGWEEVKLSKRKIIGATEYGFRGSYFDTGVQCLSHPKIKVGFVTLMRSMIGLIKGNGMTFDFLNVCVNLCEPVRIKTVVQYIAGNMREGNIYCDESLSIEFEFWITNYGKSCDAVKGYAKNCQTIDANYLRDLEDNNMVVFDIHDGETPSANYAGLITGIIALSTGNTAANIKPATCLTDIPTTVYDSTPPVFLVHVTGEYHGFAFNDYLLVAKSSIYCYAVSRYGEWYESSDTEFSIKDAAKLGFRCGLTVR